MLYNIVTMAKYYFGTAGWSYKDWEGVVYPTSKGTGFHALVFLAAYINIMEINSTFYRTPAVHMALSWVKKIDPFPEFQFAVKLHQVFTHQREDFGRKEVDEFKLGIEPLRTKGRLAALLLQFPWSFALTTAHLDYLERLFRLFTDYPLALEVRHGSWDNPQFYSLLSQHGVAFCNIDQPLFKNSIEPSSRSTTPEFAYVRLHGRNYKTWFKKDAGRDARYDYLYSKDELDEWVNRIKELGSKSEKVYVITNNHYRGQALANALQLKNLISGEKLDIPLSLVKQYPQLKTIIDKIKEGQLDLFNDEEKTPAPPDSQKAD
jgi:uncharacterized protein YecE (DUF72 family)